MILSAGDEVELTARLVAIDTSDGGEDAVLDVVSEMLSAAGLEVLRIPWRDGRGNLVAHWAGGGRLVLSGHADTVPFDSSGWQVDPLGADIVDDRLFGRGSSDMKSGLAAMVCAAIDAAATGAQGFSIAVTSGEETGCLGARSLVAASLLPDDPILVIGESTGNEVRLGHKGATWLQATARGVSAHGSRPDLGLNAIEALAAAIELLSAVEERSPHPRLGQRTTNVGTISGGLQTNLVPDLATMTVDVRTVPGAGADDVIELLQTRLGQGSIDVGLDLPPVWTNERLPLAAGVERVVRGVTGRQSPAPSGVSYFTDAAVLGRAPGARTFILGPGDTDQPHTTDESCSIAAIGQARQIYNSLVTAWSDGQLDEV